MEAIWETLGLTEASRQSPGCILCVRSRDGEGISFGFRQKLEVEMKGAGCCHCSFSWVMSLLQPETAVACVYPENSSIMYGRLRSTS